MKHFGRAAQRTYQSKASFTRQIQRLERALGCTLLTRSGKGATLTDAGTRFLKTAQEVLYLLEVSQSYIFSYQGFGPER